ncbi:3-hydroxyacyl-CoA dehydrogenase family protein [Ottowia thiooxydans]|uniref:3-hydroxyacyl-CoA dehydrogenase family protein n=1 Tax=Ottowia thiooxydans TaxID=219182 RepID=UPI0003F8077A|nr:3-hydroxyacyl-CoA dehydrogenase family protein [Ottowia thiooxydans]
MTAPQEQPRPGGLTLNGRGFTPGSARVAVLGAGVMGPGIALVFAEYGYQVDLCEVRQPALDAGMASLADALNLKVHAQVCDPASARATLARVTPRIGIAEGIAHADLIVEAVPEDREIKRAVYTQVADTAPAHAVVWSNTSTLDVFSLAPPAVAPRLLVAHWFAPPHILPLVEVVCQDPVPESLREESVALLRALGKAPVVLEKFVPGFVINRLLRALGRESFDMIESGVISIAELDVAVRTSLAPRMQVLGIMQRYDYTGLNLSLRNLADPDIVDAPVNRSPALLQERVARGELGVASGSGFYDYGGRSTLELQRERDLRLWQVMRGLAEHASDPKPI